MSERSRLSLAIPDARQCAEVLFDRMMDEEMERRQSIEFPTSRDLILEKIAAEHPDGHLVPSKTMERYKVRAALAYEGLSDLDQQPAGLLEIIRSNQGHFRLETQDVEASVLIDPREAIFWDIYLLGREAYLETFAHNFAQIGRVSLEQYREAVAA